MRTKLLFETVLAAGAILLASCGDNSLGPNPATTSTHQAALESNTWLVRHNVPYDWTGMVTAAVPNAAGQTILYAIGGSTPAGACLGRVQAYNLATDTWKSRTDLLAALCGINGAAVVNGKIYVAGGAPTAKGPVASLYMYDPTTNVWTQKRSMPEPGSGGISGVIKGRLYVVTITKTGAKFFRYAPSTDTWVRLPSTDYWWLGGGGGVINDRLYLIAQAVKMFDPATNQWTTKGQLPGDLHGASAVVRRQLYIFGADTRPGREDWGIFVYDPIANTWTRKRLLATLKDSYNPLGASKVFLNGEPRVEVVGGARPENNLQYIP